LFSLFTEQALLIIYLLSFELCGFDTFSLCHFVCKFPSTRWQTAHVMGAFRASSLVVAFWASSLVLLLVMTIVMTLWYLTQV
ncbi:hypothetical protein ScPMuIL_018065, partial [Solemya velum]